MVYFTSLRKLNVTGMSLKSALSGMYPLLVRYSDDGAGSPFLVLVRRLHQSGFKRRFKSRPECQSALDQVGICEILQDTLKVRKIVEDWNS
jgi:hypothetical protein